MCFYWNKHFKIHVSCSDEDGNCIQGDETICKLMKLHACSWNCMQAQGSSCKPWILSFWSLLEVFLKSSWILPEFFLNSSWSPPEVFLKSSRSLPEVFQKSSWSLPWNCMHSGTVQNVLQGVPQKIIHCLEGGNTPKFWARNKSWGCFGILRFSALKCIE